MPTAGGKQGALSSRLERGWGWAFGREATHTLLPVSDAYRRQDLGDVDAWCLGRLETAETRSSRAGKGQEQEVMYAMDGDWKVRGIG